jgi:hypothetical protein
MGDYLGSAGAFVDRALAARGTRRPVPEEVVP